MGNRKNRIIFHIDVNSAFLSWSSVYNLQQGEAVDFREIPAVIGGDSKSRHGVVLAKSISAKKYNIKTGESIFSAKKKCPQLKVIPPEHHLYRKYSNAMMDILKTYTPMIEKFSIDECFMDLTGIKKAYEDPENFALSIKESIKKELGFTVNIGISSNKLLAKMASDFEKPDRIHTLYPDEIQKKMWPLPVENLFMVGRAAVPRLHKLHIKTIGELANCDLKLLKNEFKNYGALIWNYARGIENSEVKDNSFIKAKSIGNSTTLSADIEDRVSAHKILLALCETVSMRLRSSKSICKVVTVVIKNSDFISYSKQKQLYNATDSTKDITKAAYEIFDKVWRGDKIRLLGVSVSHLSPNELYQTSLFDSEGKMKNEKLDRTLDSIRSKYGSNSIMRGVFVKSKVKTIK
ncbi:DNA polymerase IV [Clostridium pasteurianum DSM 525 = ATCC 6013]|uniref:DNA polymerase IV n=1 Tax=Clostridium pasteurianum DSM 525 = ATCC 6013 TaxID=1262449 RepID=A0A0H3JB12_CLOPA|nr:DNA polymerase IV [Clostridium pasteurianum]AJA48985.1 DNA polymerase IV [Clostridium pasteurianum DSM 525 = ATCC 6013]AJA52973.1 DNA polymerase IV [Clostridium pasteurianum DSM 525 = ATCC 6013]AOZ76192.1 DNA polymerase IV [Clostridium pasteurianum DSM 525 = ATCC 6013]AOZ79988.1 DNA polymerase IV [Clostridium pasteurianum]ELP60281.1 nucleotidyltransferase/DNA polymerase [Clostridium pasteurianum DSM 525 = ATCC 6013]